MNKNVDNIVRHYCAWTMNSFVMTVGVSVAFWLIAIVFNIKADWRVLGWVCIFTMTIIIMAQNALFSSQSTTGDYFSWKFLQSLPLSKKNLLHAINFCNLITSLPVLICLLLCWSDFQRVEEFRKLFDYNIFKFTINYLLFFYIVSLLRVYTVISLPRLRYLNIDKKNQTLVVSRYFAIMIAVAVFTRTMINRSSDLFEISFSEYIDKISDSLMNLTVTWWFPVVLAIVAIVFFQAILKYWVTEKINKEFNEVNVKSELSIVGFCIVATVVSSKMMGVSTPTMYEGNALNAAVYEKNYTKLEKLLSKNNDIHKRNNYGFNPIFVAIHEGNLPMIKFLEKKGANFSGNLSDESSNHYEFNALFVAIDSKNKETLEYLLNKGFDVNDKLVTKNFYSPIHLAAKQCDSKIVDFLIQKGANINQLNSNGETPVLVAARTNCFSAAVALKDNGASFDVADSKGNRPLDYFKKKNKNQEFKYYLEKYSRAPASN
ncbi:MAG: ankyrin repeat domain-containing protein [Bdellovibrionales bacterium]|nr:ankyrin repeat domain-containing protein [Bdellovibrionales bacterium]